MAFYDGDLRPKQPATQADPGHHVRAQARQRHIPAAVRRAVYERGGGRCRFVDAKGRRCTARDRSDRSAVDRAPARPAPASRALRGGNPDSRESRRSAARARPPGYDRGWRQRCRGAARRRPPGPRRGIPRGHGRRSHGTARPGLARANTDRVRAELEYQDRRLLDAVNDGALVQRVAESLRKVPLNNLAPGY